LPPYVLLQIPSHFLLENTNWQRPHTSYRNKTFKARVLQD